MTNLKQPMAGEGKLSGGIRRLTAQANVIFPANTPNMLTSRTVRGTFQRTSRRTRATTSTAGGAARWL